MKKLSLSFNDEEKYLTFPIVKQRKQQLSKFEMNIKYIKKYKIWGNEIQ